MNQRENFPDEKLFDMDTALKRVGNDRDFLKELIGIFDEEFSSHMKQLKQAVSRGGFEEVKEIAHCLKGASANLSFTSFQELSYQMELLGSDKNLSPAGELISMMEEEYKKLQQYLAKLNLI